MNMPLRIVGIGGSLGNSSSSLTALRIALQGAAEHGAETKLLDIRELDLPMFVPKTEDIPESARILCETVYEADGLIWSSPLYHGTISGSFKNALDWLDLLQKSDPPFLTDKVIGLISTAGGVQGLQAVNTMEFVVRALRGWAVPLVIPISNAYEIFDGEGNILSFETEEKLKLLGRKVAESSLNFSSTRFTIREFGEDNTSS